MYSITSFIIACVIMFSVVIIVQTGVVDTINIMAQGGP